MQTSLQALEQQHVAVCTSNRSLAEQLHKMEQRMQQLEAQNTMLQQQGQQLQQQLGSPAPTNKYAAYSQHRPSSGTYVSIMSAGASTAEDAGQAALPVHGMPGGRSMAARLTKLEQQVDSLASTSAATEVRTSRHEQWLSLQQLIQHLCYAVGSSDVKCNTAHSAHRPYCATVTRPRYMQACAPLLD
jgi:hypothetical protein